jgi:hypothetical protein
MTELCRDDAAYVLGALSPADRRIFETHLGECSVCQRSVRELAGLPGLLTKVRPVDFDVPDEPPPATLLPALVGEVRRRRDRRRWLVGGLAAAAAVVAVVAALGIRGLVQPADQPPTGVAMSQLTETAISARAQLVTKPWGTQIDLLCRYDVASPYGRPRQTYALVVTDDAGRTRQVATWKVLPRGVSTVTGSIGWDRADIAAVEIRTLAGTPVLRLST